MSFRDDVEAARLRLVALERKLAALDVELAERDRAIAARDEALIAEQPTERHRVRLRQLEVAIAQTRAETALIRERARSVGRGS